MPRKGSSEHASRPCYNPLYLVLRFLNPHSLDPLTQKVELFTSKQFVQKGLGTTLSANEVYFSSFLGSSITITTFALPIYDTRVVCPYI